METSRQPGPEFTTHCRVAEADEAVLIAAAAAFVLCVGLIFAMRAFHAGIGLATMRSDFVSSVTHDLKMPPANIRVIRSIAEA